MENQLNVQASMNEDSRCPHDNMVHNLTWRTWLSMRKRILRISCGKVCHGVGHLVCILIGGGLRVLEKYGVVVPERPKKNQFYARKRYPLQWLWKSKSMIMLSPTKTCGSQHSIRSCGRRSNTIYHTSLGTGTLLEGWDSWMPKYRRICQMFFCWTCDENCRNKSKVLIP